MKKGITPAVILFVIVATLSCTKDSMPAAPSKPQVACLPSNLQNNVLAFYSFSSGTIADISGNGNHLTNPSTASAGTDRGGNPNCAFSFNRTNNDHLKLASPAFLNNIQTGVFSISLWYKPTGIRQGIDYETLISRDTVLHCPDTQGQWSVGLYDCRRAVFGINQSCVWEPMPVVSSDCDSSLASLSGSWQHIVLTSSSSGIKLYKNGTLVAQSSITATCSVSIPTLNTGDLFIGRYFTGSIDDLLIYNSELSINEVTQLYQLTPCCE